MSPGKPRSTRSVRGAYEWALITLILLVAALFRFHALGDIPKGLEHDEVATWHMVTSVLEGQRPIYFEEGYGHEPLYNYLTALPMALWGQNWLGERFWAPWLGMLAVAATYALMRRLFNSLVGLSAAGLQGTVLWAFFFNRLGLRLNLLPFLLCVTAYCFWRGVERIQSETRESGNPGIRKVGERLPPNSPIPRFPNSSISWFAAAGVLMGLCFYTYMSSRVVPLLFGAFSVYLVAHDLWIQKRDRRPAAVRAAIARWWPLALCFVIAALVMAPLALYLLNRPPDTATPQREGQVDRPLQKLLDGDPRPVLENAWALLKMWNVDGERYWQLNYSHRPVFVEPIGGVLFWIGALVVLWNWKQPRFALLAMWIALGMVPSLLTSEAPSWPRTMLASPAALALPGIAVWGLGNLNLRSLVSHLLVLLLVASHLITAALTYRDFLVVWPEQPRVRYAFQSSMTEAMRFLDAADENTPVVMAGLSPHDMDPWTERSTLRRTDLEVRWVDTRSALIVPAGERSRLVTLDITPVDPALARWAGLGPGTVLAQGEVVPRGGTEHQDGAPVYYDPAYTVFRLDGAALQERIESAESRAYAGGDPFAPTPLETAPQFGEGPEGGLVRLAGYEWLDAPQAGRPAQLLTYWQALRTGPRSTIYGQPALRTFVHLLDRDQTVVDGADVLGAAPDTWQAGDTIVQLHTWAAPAAPGVYAVEMGWYVPPDGPRLAIQGVDAPEQRILLVPVEVRP
jgi:4-amino-4-deoxy-L-arabinose transferase-like glycosyltransferase